MNWQIKLNRYRGSNNSQNLFIHVISNTRCIDETCYCTYVSRSIISFYHGYLWYFFPLPNTLRRLSVNTCVNSGCQTFYFVLENICMHEKDKKWVKSSDWKGTHWVILWNIVRLGLPNSSLLRFGWLDVGVIPGLKCFV